jgi:class 3 adenylate cyclase
MFSKTTIESFTPFKYSGYLFSFYFFLDFLAILSMIPDINWIADGLGIGGISETVASTNNNLSKAGRVVRTVRLVRLVRLYKIHSERYRQQEIEEQQQELVRQGLLTQQEIDLKKHLNQERNSKVGAELSQTTTQRVIVIVLVMLCVVPILNFSETDILQEYSIKNLHEFNVRGNDVSRQNALDEFITYFGVLSGRVYCIYLTMEPFQSDIILRQHNLNIVRSTGLNKIIYESTVNGIDYRTIGYFDNTLVIHEIAQYGIILTIVVSFVMLIGTIVFTNDVQVLVLNPIERMMNMVDEVAKHPLEPIYLSSNEGRGDEYETKLLQSTIEKITSLLRIGFGEAGAGIISANLRLDDNNALINPLIPGVRMYAIFGFCDIHHFEDANEKLGKDIMTFVNTIAGIVHSNVHEWRGQSNKNLGQAFLVVWRIGDEAQLAEILQNTAGPKKEVRGGNPKKKNQNIDLRRVPGVDLLADSALVAYLKIIAEINRNQTILDYRHEPRLTNNGTHEFSVHMGFGLHAGWAIEGAVGSLQKVDATYLSPHVNMAARLETSSKQYGVPLLASQTFYDLMSPEAQNKCRRLDVVTVKGSEFPIGIYTYDALQDQPFYSKKHFPAGMSPPVFMKPVNEMTDVFEKDYDLVTLRNHITSEFLSVFNSGIEAYLGGEWEVAKEKLEQANSLMALVPTMKGDGPCLTLLRYMEDHGWKAPSSWKGYRPLTSK